jgi:hypothetical protein
MEGIGRSLLEIVVQVIAKEIVEYQENPEEGRGSNLGSLDYEAVSSLYVLH